MDEIHVQVLKENGRRAEDKSWMWVNKALVKIIKELPLAKNIEDFERAWPTSFLHLRTLFSKKDSWRAY
ncbi:MAG: hypothetical protein ACK5P7_04800 [Bdellovibrio sp.]